MAKLPLLLLMDWLYFCKMTLEEKATAVYEVFKKLDGQITTFQSNTTLHCKWGCGKCCFKPDIEATILEFLPFAFDLYKKKQAEDWWNNLRDNPDPICAILNTNQSGAGLCSVYEYRGLICRLFGYSARTNKYSKLELITCRIIKSEQEQAYTHASTKLDELDIPVMSNYYRQLHAIDADLTASFYPINIAIRKAIETVLHYYAYRN